MWLNWCLRLGLAVVDILVGVMTLATLGLWMPHWDLDFLFWASRTRQRWEQWWR